MSNTSPFDALHNGGAFTLLEQFSVIEVSGADAITFLHNQLTNEIRHLGSTATQLAGLCSPKGRLLTSMLVWHTAETVQLMVPSDLLEAVQKKLSMFIFRSKVKLADVTDQLMLIGLMGVPEDTLTSLFPTLPQNHRDKVESATGALVRLADLPNTPINSSAEVEETSQKARARYLWIARRDTNLTPLTDNLTRVASTVWDWLDIQAGEPRVTEATQEKFVPQMVNFDLIGGLNFRKGCYPGQEIIIRLQYRGVIRRRTILAHTQSAQAGLDVFTSADAHQPCGVIVNAAPAPNGGVDCLVELQLNALKQGTLHLGTASGPALELLTLPYALPEVAE